MATLAGQGRARAQPAFRHEGILGTVYTGELLREVHVGAHAAVVPTVGGQAWITGYSTTCSTPTDPFVNGYTVGDLWA